MILPNDRFAFKSSRSRRPRRYVPILVGIVVVSTVVAVGIWQRDTVSGWFGNTESEHQSLEELWSAKEYAEIVDQTDAMLDANPVDMTSLVYGGFARFYLSTEVYTLEEKLPFINAAIVMLRKALVLEKPPLVASIEYVLGKAYHFKGRYYSDLSIAYLERSVEHGYTGNDTYEYLGLAYSDLGFYEKSAAYFKRAIDVEATDMRYLALAQAYLNADDIDSAEENLLRTINKTDDPAIEQKSRFLLGKIYFDLDQLTKAEDQYRKILELNPRSADAHYYLGEIYLRYGKPVEARAQWREALIIDPTHYGARLRYYK